MRHRRRLGIAHVAGKAEDHQLQVHTDLRRGQAGALGGLHGVEHVGDQRMQLGRVEFAHRGRHAQQAGIAHLQDLSNGQGGGLLQGWRHASQAAVSARLSKVTGTPVRA